MRKLATLVVSALAVAGLASPASADVHLQIQNGRVTLVARDATVRQILTEWARIGQTRIVNVERIPGGPVTLEFRDLPEQQALKVLLRSVGGYVTAPREIMAANLSLFDRIIVMPTVATPPSAASSPASSALPPPAFATFQPPQQLQTPDEDRDEPGPGPTVTPAQPQQPGNRGPVFVFPSPQGSNPQQPVNQPQVTPPPTAMFPGAPTTTAPAGVSTPGMMVPTPQPPPGQPVPPPGRREP